MCTHDQVQGWCFFNNEGSDANGTPSNQEKNDLEHLCAFKGFLISHWVDYYHTKTCTASTN